MAKHTDTTKRANDIRVGDWVRLTDSYASMLVADITKTTDVDGAPVVQLRPAGWQHQGSFTTIATFYPTDAVTLYRNFDLSSMPGYDINLYATALIDSCRAIDYWAEILNPSMVFSVPGDPTSDWISYDITDHQDDAAPTFHVDHDTIHLGFEMALHLDYANERVQKLCASNGADGDYDAFDLDIVVQLATLGSTIYG